MRIDIKQVSSLEKIRSFSDAKTEINNSILLKGEVFSFQQIISFEKPAEIEVTVNSELKDYINLYEVKDAVMDFPCYPDSDGEGYITTEAGLMPDILMPLEYQKGIIKFQKGFSSVWVEIKVPADIEKGEYNIDIQYNARSLTDDDKATETKGISLEILEPEIPEQKLIVTQWFHVDCIADVHNVPVYSEEHWYLISEYMKEAVKQGQNMILTPVITPPLDTKPETLRPNTQLVKISKCGDIYSFDFSMVKRFIDLAKRTGFEYFEISHLFSQWGLRYSPNIYVTEDGEEKRLFGWHIPANDKSYKEFLEQFLPALVEFLKSEGIMDNCYFHISDEPTEECIGAYRYAYEVVRPLLKDAKIMDALSDIAFYDTGLVPNPVTATNHIEPFLAKNIENQWAYYCSGQHKKVANRFLAMPSYRNRILGIQLYKYGIKGFLQWGFNFYYSQLSLFEINPYMTTSSEKAFPSGDPFSVYPAKSGPVPSLRAKVFKEAVQDVSILKLLEKYIGKDEVIKFIEENAGMEITFSEYPNSSEFLLDLNAKIKEKIKSIRDVLPVK